MENFAGEPELQKLLALAVKDHNVLPLTGRCNLECVFCSHLQNPPGTRAYSFPPLPESLLQDLMTCLDPGHKIIIGESATRLREGEPFTHPRVIDILKQLRSFYPATPFQVTTNGSLFSEEVISALAGLQPLELIVSLNSASGEGRRKVMRDRMPGRAIEGLRLLKEYGLPFHGSVVALPHLTGWDDLRETVGFLEHEKALTVRILLPGFTRISEPASVPPPGTLRKCYRFIEDLRASGVRIPLLAEPPLVTDLDPTVEGIIAGTPAAKAGLAAGDRIISVQKREPLSRVDCYDQLVKGENPAVVFSRGGRAREAIIEKKAGERPGAAFSYDLDPKQVGRVKTFLSGKGQTLMLGSTPALRRWEIAAQKFDLQYLAIGAVASDYFGGSIDCAGLLTVVDYQAYLNGLTNMNQYDLILLPAVSFDYSGHDMAGDHYLSLYTCGVPFKIIG